MRSTFTLCSLLSLVHATRVESECLLGLEADINANSFGYRHSGVVQQAGTQNYGYGQAGATTQAEVPETDCPCKYKDKSDPKPCECTKCGKEKKYMNPT